VYSTRESVDEAVLGADVVVGAVLVPGARAPIVVREDVVRQMQPGRVIIDISIDQGGCIETSRPTTHHEPVYTKHDVVHYCVGNIPGAVPHTSTHALTHATLPYIEALVNTPDAIATNAALRAGVNVSGGKVTNIGVAESHGLAFEPLT
jgi:alanine dehydrogenase